MQLDGMYFTEKLFLFYRVNWNFPLFNNMSPRPVKMPMGLFDNSPLQLGFQVLYTTVLEENLTSRFQQRFTITLFPPLAKLQRLLKYSCLELPFVAGNLKYHSQLPPTLNAI